MTYTIDRFEDGGLAVLETDAGESVMVPRAQVPPEAREGDVLLELDGRLASGIGVSTDILEAAGKAYLRALSIALDNAVSEAERVLEAEAKKTPTP